jgi:hypothetical protein
LRNFVSALGEIGVVGEIEREIGVRFQFSNSGTDHPKPDMDLVNARLKAAKQDFEIRQAQQGARK